MAKEDKPKKKPEGILVVKGNADKADRAARDGGIEATFYVEAHGSDQDSVAEALKGTLLRDLKNEEGVTLREVKFHPVIEKEKLYSGFVECNFVARDPQVLIYLSIRFGPSAVEVDSPDSVTLTGAELQNIAATASGAVQVLTAKIMELMSKKDRIEALEKGLKLGAHKE